MSEIYWITRLDVIQGFCIAFLVVGIAFIFITIMRMVASTDSTEPSITNKFKWIGIILTIIFAPLTMFVPTSRDAMLIFGIGTTIDYIQSNETAKQLPDKCIEALDTWVESLNVNENEKNR